MGEPMAAKAARSSISGLVSTFSDAAAGIESLVTAAGIIGGGIWAYYRFIKDRVYSPRLDVRIEASRQPIGGASYLDCAVSVHNVGLSKVKLLHTGSGIRI